MTTKTIQLKKKKKNKVKCETCQDKSFCNWEANRIHLNLPNGNHMSIVWGWGTYSDNYDMPNVSLLERWKKFMNSNTCEVMFDCPPKKEKKILRHFKTDNQPLGYLTNKDFVWLFNELSKIRKTSKSVKVGGKIKALKNQGGVSNSSANA